MISISNDRIIVEINPFGAELKRIYDKKRDIEYLWRGDEVSWNESSPLLFPFVGRFHESRYIYKGKCYQQTIHGFIRHRVFRIEDVHSSKVSLIYESTEEDFKIYPFRFCFKCIIEIKEAQILLSYEVHNKNDYIMYHAFGLHPGFNLPLSKDKEFNDYSLEFASMETKECIMTPNCLYSGKDKDAQKTYLFHHANFDNDAQIFRNTGKCVSLREDGNEVLSITSNNLDVITIWHRPGTNDGYACIEPCSSIPGYDGRICQLEEMKDYFVTQAGDTTFHDIVINLTRSGE